MGKQHQPFSASFTFKNADIYILFSLPTITGTLADTTGVFDVYLRVGTQGNNLAFEASLNDVAANSILAFIDGQIKVPAANKNCIGLGAI